MGYANVNECDDKILQAVKDGANVVTWFSINLVQDSSSLVSVAGFSQFACAANISSALKSLGFDNITHLISIGGWGVPHIDAASISPAQAYAAWKSWNSPVNGFQFDGIDWDVEGDDTVSSPNNYMTLPLLQLMGQVSQMAKADGFIV